MTALVVLNDLIPAEHPLRRLKAVADEILRAMDVQFAAMYSETGRPSIPPETLLKGQLLVAMFSIRSERQLCEQIRYNLLFRWFLDMEIEDRVFVPTVYAKNRDRLMEHEVAARFFEEVVSYAGSKGLMSDEHFTVDGTLIEAWASLKSFRKQGEAPKPPEDDDPGNPTIDFRGEKRTNATHRSTTDPESRMARKSWGTTARLCFGASALMENRNGLLLDLSVFRIGEDTERTVAMRQLSKVASSGRRVTVGADRAYDTHDFVRGCRERNITPHVAQNLRRQGGSAIDRRTTRFDSYKTAQKARKRVEEIFGWAKTIGGFRRTRYRGRDRTQVHAEFVGAAYNLLRIAKLIHVSPNSVSTAAT
jgi:transposase